MFSRTLRTSRVCLQCRRSLAQANLRHRMVAPFACQADQPRRYAYDARRLTKEEAEALIGKLPSKQSELQTTEDNTPVREEVLALDAEEVASATEIESDESNPVDTTNTTLTPQPQVRKRRENPLLRHQSLSVESLGLPVEALVINNPNQLRPKRPSARLLEGEEARPFISSEWTDWIPKTDATPEQEIEEVCANIEELRPVDSNVIPHRQFADISHVLVDGFSKEQISRYMARNLPSNDTTDATSIFPWVVKQSRWIPESKLLPSKMKPKESLAIEMMRTTWSLEIEEEVSGLGTTDIWIPRQHFHLLTRYNSRILDEIRSELREGMANEQISASSNEQVVSILSKKLTAAVILSRLDEFFSRVRSKAITLSTTGKLAVSLREIGRATNTVVENGSRPQEYLVYWVADKLIETSEELAREDKADIVWRFLASEPADAAHTSQQTVWPSKTERSGFHVPFHRDKRGLQWKDRSGSWSRLVAERCKSQGQAIDEPRLKAPTAKDVHLPHEESRVVLSATFGQILHRADARKASDRNTERRLAPAIPHPAALSNIALSDDATTLPLQTDIILNFSCDPSYSGSVGDMPQVRLRLPIGPETDLATFTFPAESTLNAVSPLLRHDILLPGSTADISVTQTRLFSMAIDQPAIQDFIAKSEFNLLEGRLHTPFRTTFDLPGLSLRQPSANSDELVAGVPFIFMGLEIEQSVKSKFEGHTIQYNSVEAGQQGGQRQQLALLYGSPGQDGLLTDTSSYAEFVRLAYGVATGKYFSWEDGHKLMQTRNQEDLVVEMDEADGQDTQQ